MRGRFVFIYILLSTQQATVLTLSSKLLILRNSLKDVLLTLDAVAEGESAIETELLSGLGRPSSCAELLLAGHTESGVYTIYPRLWFKLAPFHVYCDMETDGGGWTVLQRRDDYGEPREDFFRTWREYRKGFGNLTKEFWLVGCRQLGVTSKDVTDAVRVTCYCFFCCWKGSEGTTVVEFKEERGCAIVSPIYCEGNDHLFVLTNQDHVTLRVDLQDFEGGHRYATYGQFQVADNEDDFRVRIGKYKGDAGDNLGFDNYEFVTRDKNDVYQCSAKQKGGWWYQSCGSANLNGRYLKGSHATNDDGVNWQSWRGNNYSLKKSEMKVRPTYFLRCEGLVIPSS